MIYLIGGPPRCSKTTLAKKLSKRLKISWISGDALEGAVKPYLSETEYLKIFPKSAYREKTDNSNDKMYTKYTTKEIVDVYKKQGEAPEHVFEAIIDFMILTGQDFIIEGYHITPRFVTSMKKKSGEENFKAVFLVKTDLEDSLQTISLGKDEDDWVHTKTQDKNILVEIAKYISEYSKYFVSECKEYNVKYIDYSGSLDDYLSTASNYLLEK